MDPFHNSYADTDLASPHYITFIEPLAALPMEAFSFCSEQFMSNSTEKVIEGKINAPFILLEEHFSTAVMLYNKKYEVQFEDLTIGSSFF
jgi:hypothetical protein